MNNKQSIKNAATVRKKTSLNIIFSNANLLFFNTELKQLMRGSFEVTKQQGTRLSQIPVHKIDYIVIPLHGNSIWKLINSLIDLNAA